MAVAREGGDGAWPRHFAMFGSGGVGGYYGARLARAGHRVTFIARGRHLEALRTEGLRVTSINGDVSLGPVDATDDPASVGPVDVVFVAVKTWQLDDAIRAMPPLVGPDTVIVPLLNGVEAADRLAAALGRRPVLKGLTKILAFVDAPGHVRHVGAEPTIAFGEWDNGRTDRTRALLAALQDAGIRSAVPDDIDAALWEKLVFVVSVGGVGAVTRAPIGQVRSNDETRFLLRAAMDEIVAVARGRGIRLPAEVVERSMGFVDTLPDAGSTSLQRDLAAGRPSELDAWSGSVVRLGAEVGVPTPVHGFIAASLRLTDLRSRGDLAFSTPGVEPDAFRARYLADTRDRFAALKKQAERSLEQVDDEAFFRLLDAEANSLAVLVKHLGGNLRSRWTRFLETDGEKADRHRDGEFETDGQTRADLMAAWEVGWGALLETLEALGPDDLDATVHIRTEPHTVERAVSRSLAHAAGHVGQIVMLAKHFSGPDWKTLSIPRGQSESWLQGPPT